MSVAGLNKEVEEEEVGGGCWRKFANWFKYENKGEWLKEMKGSLNMTASIIATMTFQLATNPPGGVVQASFNDKGIKNCTTTDDACPGLSVMALIYPDAYKIFMICNTVSFFAAIGVCLLLVSGVPLNHRLPTWLLSIGMCIAITGLGFSYMLGVNLVTPNSTLNIFTGLFAIGLLVWCALLGIVALFLILRLFIWVVNKCIWVVNKCNL